MANRQEERMPEPEMNVNDPGWRKPHDRRVGTIRKMTPVTGAGTPDPARKITWVGETQVMSTMALPIHFQIEAATLGEAAGSRSRSQGWHRTHGARGARKSPPAGVLDRDSAGQPAARRDGRRRDVQLT